MGFFCLLLTFLCLWSQATKWGEAHMAEEGVLLQGEDPEWSFSSGHQKEGRTAFLKILADLPMFETMSWRELEKLERIVHRRHFFTGEVVLRAWVPRSGLFVIRSGSVHVVRHLEDGASMVVGTLGKGEPLGEFSILDDSPRSTSIVAVEPSDLVGFFRSDLMDLMQTDPRLGFKILYRLSQILWANLRDDIKHLRRIRSELEVLGVSEQYSVPEAGD